MSCTCILVTWTVVLLHNFYFVQLLQINSDNLSLPINMYHALLDAW